MCEHVVLDLGKVWYSMRFQQMRARNGVFRDIIAHFQSHTFNRTLPNRTLPNLSISSQITQSQSKLQSRPQSPILTHNPTTSRTRTRTRSTSTSTSNSVSIASQNPKIPRSKSSQVKSKRQTNRQKTKPSQAESTSEKLLIKVQVLSAQHP